MPSTIEEITRFRELIQHARNKAQNTKQQYTVFHLMDTWFYTSIMR